MSFTWSGDFNTCNFWRPFAEDRQRVLDQTVGMRSLHAGGGVGGKSLTRTLSQVYFPVPGVKIMIQINPHHIHIMAEGGCKHYLESGFYEIYSTAIYNEGSYIAEKLRLIENGFVEAVMSCEITGVSGPPQGELKPSKKSAPLCDSDFPFYGGRCMHGDDMQDGFESHAMGSPNFEGQDSLVVYSASGEPRILEGNGPYYEGLRELKQTQLKTPSCFYTGKLQLFVQALYGSVRKDYYEAFPGLGIPGIIFQGFLLERDCGLLTTSDYRYFLCRINTDDVVSFREIIPSRAADCYLKFLREYGEETWLTSKHKAYLEAYIFSACDLAAEDTEQRVSLGFSAAFEDTIDGWKFARERNEFAAIVHEFIYVDANDSHGHMRPTLFVATVDYFIGGDGAVSFSISHQETEYPLWQQSQWFVAWIPQYMPIVSHYSFGAGYPSLPDPSIDGPTPIAGYYSKDDEYVMFWVKIEKIVETTGTYDTGLPYAWPFYESEMGAFSRRSRIIANNGYRYELSSGVGATPTIDRTEICESWDDFKDLTYKEVQFRSGQYLGSPQSSLSAAYADNRETLYGPLSDWLRDVHNWRSNRAPPMDNIGDTSPWVQDLSCSIAAEYESYGSIYRYGVAMVAPMLYDRTGFVHGIHKYHSAPSAIEGEAQTWNDPSNSGAYSLGHQYSHRVVEVTYLGDGNYSYGPEIDRVDTLWYAVGGNNWWIAEIPINIPEHTSWIWQEHIKGYAEEVGDGYTLIDGYEEPSIYDPWHDVYFSQPPLIGPPIMIQTTLIGRGTFGGASKILFFDMNKSFDIAVNGFSRSYFSAVGWI